MEAIVDASKALGIIHTLANGIDPYTGEEFSVDSPYQHPQTVRALFTALRALESGLKAQKPAKRSGPETALENDELPLTRAQESLFENLRRWRSEKARQEGLAAYVIATNAQLRQMATMGLGTADDLLQIKGFGERRAQRYGNEILAICTDPAGLGAEAN
jgi:superfamily II DNA helicase RecQ